MLAAVTVVIFLTSHQYCCSTLDVDDVVSQAMETGYLQTRHMHFCTRNAEQLPRNGNIFAFLQKQDPEVDHIAIDGYTYINIMRNLVNISGKSFSDIRNDVSYKNAYKAQGCEKVTPSCQEERRSPYRSSTGVCNNLQHPIWGSALSPHARYLSPVYNDEISEPRKFGKFRLELPSPREISNKVFAKSGETRSDDKMTLMFFAFGQFLDHDLTFTPTVVGEDGEPYECCGKDQNKRGCFPIKMEANDTRFKGRTCMDFSRSVPAPYKDGCEIGYREQVNRLTSFIDGGMIYGDSKRSHEILDGLNGELRASSVETPPSGGSCSLKHNDDDFCLLAGDERINEVPSLAGMHVIFLRLHNEIAKKLKKITGWRSVKVFLETRKIMGAILQQITYGEYLPHLLSPVNRRRYGLYLKRDGYWYGYDSRVNPAVKNVVATAAFRFGHSQIPSKLGYMTHKFVSRRLYRTEDVFMDPHMILADNGTWLAELTRFICTSPSQKIDTEIENTARNELFRDGKGVTFDLMSLNIQRGRDHGLPPYGRWRKWCGLQVATSFSELTDHEPDVQDRLKDAYKYIEDIDVFVGGMSETPRGKARVGPLFECIIGQQFRDIRFGDRYWYETPEIGGFTPKQLKEIRKITLSKVVCGMMGLDQIQPDVFSQITFRNRLVNCTSLPDIDLSAWSETSTRMEDFFGRVLLQPADQLARGRNRFFEG